MDFIQQEIRLAFRFPVHFTRGVFGASNPLLETLVSASASPLPSDAVVVIDDGVVGAHPGLIDEIQGYFRHHAETMKLTAPVLVVPGGERVKNDPKQVDVILERIHAGALCRHSYVIGVGGGAVLDVVGYAAATAHRGIRLIRVPTTVLAQDDSAMGVKNGVNLFDKKNYLGTFAAPFAVINDFTFLPTLLDRDWLGGLSEAIKAALIKDPDFFEEIDRLAPRLVNRDLPAMETIVRRSAALHLAHIAGGGDPFELGSSRPLDFGHWAAHKLEQLTDHRLRHGEAVAIGIALDTTYSCLSGTLPEAEWRRVIDLLLALKLPVYAPELGYELDRPEHPRSVLKGLAEFREHLGGQLTIMLLGGIGQSFDVHEIDTEVMIRGIEVLRRLDAARASHAVEDPLAASSSRGPS